MRLGCYPLVVDPIIHKKCLTKVLMDGGSGLNILYVDTLDAMRIPRLELRLAGSPFHRSTCPSHSAAEPTSVRRFSPSKWWTF